MMTRQVFIFLIALKIHCTQQSITVVATMEI